MTGAGAAKFHDNSSRDPLRYDVDLPFREIFYPMGFPVEISTNFKPALQVAARLWSKYPALSNTEPVRIRIICEGDSKAAPTEPAPPRGQGHLVTIVHGPHDFGIADLAKGFAFACLSQMAVSDYSYFRYHFLEPLVYVMQAARHFVFVHASCISINGSAIVLCGDSGSGKTCLAYACAKRGWDFVSGDAVHIVRGSEDYTVIGRPYEIRFRQSARELFPELRVSIPEVRANGKVDLEVDTGDLGIRVALYGTARHIVFIERSAVSAIAKYAREDAMRRLEQTICFGDDHTRSLHRDALERFSGLPIWRLQYADALSADRALQKLLAGDTQC